MCKVSGKAFYFLAGSLLILVTGVTQAQPIEVDRVFAVVDDDVVLKSEFDERWAQIEQQIAQTPIGQRPPTAEVRKQLLDQLILEHLQMQMAERAGVPRGARADSQQGR